jgi:hypothetical protein
VWREQTGQVQGPHVQCIEPGRWGSIPAWQAISLMPLCHGQAHPGFQISCVQRSTHHWAYCKSSRNASCGHRNADSHNSSNLSRNLVSSKSVFCLMTCMQSLDKCTKSCFSLPDHGNTPVASAALVLLPSLVETMTSKG